MRRHGLLILCFLMLVAAESSSAQMGFHEKILEPGQVEMLFQKEAESSSRFAVGLLRFEDGWAVADRHRDEIVLLDQDGNEKGVIAFPAYEPSALGISGDLLVAGDRTRNRIYFIDPATGVCRHNIESPIKPLSALAVDGKGRIWVAADRTEKMQLIDPEDGTTLREIPAPTSHITALAFDPAGYLWCADRTRDLISLVDINSGLTIFNLESPGPYPSGLWYENGRLFVLDYQSDEIRRADVSDLHGSLLRQNARRGKVTLYTDLHELGPGKIESGTLVLAVPEDGPNQILDDIDMPEGGEIAHDQWGQQVLRIPIKNLDAGHTFSQELSVTGTFYATSTIVYPHLVGSLKEIPDDISARYLRDEDKYRITDPYIVEKVDEIAGGEENPYFIARQLYEFLIGRINYEMVGGWDVAPTVIRRGTGSCSEYTFAYIALCRAAGIPARYVGAMVLRGDDASIDRAFHRWAEIYLPRVGWIPVDVNAGDEPGQADRASSFGGIANRFLITTRGGGNSTQLEWDYNLLMKYESKGKANVELESWAEWDRAE